MKNLEQNHLNKEDRKEFVKKQREKLKADPGKFLEEEVIEPFIDYWKNHTMEAILNFSFWIIVFYLGFGLVQAVNNDMIYCTSSHEQFEGKVMYVANDFVAYYNKIALNREMNYAPINQIDAEKKVNEFNAEYWLKCDYDLNRWNNESVKSRINTIWYGLKKILLKRR